MRLSEIAQPLAEGRVIDTKFCKVWQNPSREEFRTLVERWYELRGILSGRDLFLWDASRANHTMVDDDLGVAGFSSDPTRVDLYIADIGIPARRLAAEWQNQMIEADWFQWAAYGGRQGSFRGGREIVVNHPVFGRFLT